MERLWIFSHLVGMLLQARLFLLAWTQPGRYLDDRRVRWTRLGLLPATLGLLLLNHARVRHTALIPRPLKVNLGCMFAQNLFKTVLLAFNRPSPARVAKLRQAGPQPALSAPAALFQSLSLIVSGSTNPSKQPKLVTGGPNHTLRADLVFLLSTIRRMVVLNLFGILALYGWKSVHDEGLVGRYPMLKRHKPQITAVVWGVFIWTGIDLPGCVARLAAFAAKTASRSATVQRLLPDFSRVDLEQTCPFLFANSPLEASSISAFWGRHWHTVLQALFVEAGAIPLSALVRAAFAPRRPPPKLLRLTGIFGAFAVSAIMHELGIWCAGPFDRRLRTSVFFLSQALAMGLENGFKSLSGRRVGGPLGRVWAFAWLIFFGAPMIAAWMESLAIDKHSMFEAAERLGFWRMLATPLVLPSLIFSRN
ncbi:hypothetical protein PtA15_1A709 [Puccinia triticina]|uniref:Wax synthase domain-containing protein n=2 Tax=Puccinia triticina TaxID=208348 RepID=A0ABY7C874_9BASI|nr:uncharacterized protein PtA15_1A709 [Puccinia triticina]WAQ81368.1 hypothetical protein PtA15_1A709 [Puccinia triticina]